MQIQGVEGMSVGEVEAEIARGGRFVMFTYCVSFLVMTLRRPTDVFFVKANESAVGKGMPYTLLSLVLGWWGIPWGFIYTPMAVIENLSGGKVVTAEVMQSLTSGARA